jgi:hypothetical protein
MRCQLRKQISGYRSAEDLLDALKHEFQRQARLVACRSNSFTADKIARRLGAISRIDETTVSILPCNGELIAIADIYCRPSPSFWCLLGLALLSVVLWPIPVLIYLAERRSVRRVVAECLGRVQADSLRRAPMELSSGRISPGTSPNERRSGTKLFVRIENEIKGPFDRRHLKVLADAGLINSRTKARPEGADSWQPLIALRSWL